MNGVHSRFALVVPEKRFIERCFSVVISRVFYGVRRSSSDGTLIFVLQLRDPTICFDLVKTAVVVVT